MRKKTVLKILDYHLADQDDTYFNLCWELIDDKSNLQEELEREKLEKEQEELNESNLDQSIVVEGTEKE